VRRGIRWFGIALLIPVAAAGLFALFNWTLAANLWRTSGATIADTARFTPRATVKGCPGVSSLPTAPLPPGTLAAAQRYSDREQGRGLIVLVDGKLAYERYASGFTAETRTLGMSMHKSVLGLLMGNAIRDGLIGSVDDPVGRYLVEWKDDPRGRITLRQLMAMAGGLKNPAMGKFDFDAFELALGNEATAAALNASAVEPPGSRFNYTSVNAQLIGTVLDRAARTSGRGGYARYLSDSLWCAIGNADALLWLDRPGGDPRYFAYLDAGLRDWARIGQLMLDRGQINGRQVVPSAWIDTMIAPSPRNPNYGLLVWRGTPWIKARPYNREIAMTVPQGEPFLANDVVYFDGFGGQRVYVIPSRRIVIARVGEMSMTWDESALVNAVLRALPAAAAAPRKALRQTR
jgi:CubicO group peptidase (beta-lactamase class C family)